MQKSGQLFDSPIAPLRVSGEHTHAESMLSESLIRAFQHAGVPGGQPITIVCIGSDRSTGDSLGPLVGSRLQEARHPGALVKGTLDQPIHAANLAEHVERLRSENDDRLVVAVDACLGRAENVGTVCLKPGPLRPGTGVNKELPEVGDIHIVGVVNIGGFMEYFVLQNTRLNLVVRLANLIANSLLAAISHRWSAEEPPVPATQGDVAATLD